MADPWVLGTQQWLNQTYGTHAQWVWVEEDGLTGWPTMEGLTRALQIELGITSLSPNFGPTTLAMLTSQYGNIGIGQHHGSGVVKIIQGGSYCKGFNASNGAINGVFDAQMQTAVASMRTSLGLPSTPATVTPKMFKGLLTMDAWSLVAGGTAAARQAQQALNNRYIGKPEYFLCPTDGLYGRQMQEKLMIAIQYEAGIAAPNGNFGPATQAAIQSNGVFGPGFSDSSGYWCHLFQAALRFNGYPATPFTGTFDTATQTQMQAFQNFIKLANTSGATFSTWASLLVSSGDPNRPATGADASMEITVSRLATLQGQGYNYFGRCLVNTMGPTDLDKCIKRNELGVIHTYGGRVWPIFQTGGADPSHFTYRRGYEVSEEAANAAWAYRIPANSIIYFAVDFDVLDSQINELILPYFDAVTNFIGTWGQSSYRVGIYAPRLVCQRVADAGFSVSSFVSDMSEAFSGNKGYLLPSNWAFDQIYELDVGSGAGQIRIDRNVVSGADTGFGSLAPEIGVRNDPLIPSGQLDSFEDAWYWWCRNHPQAVIADVMVANRARVKSLVSTHDAFITTQAANLGVYKAMALTPLIWEAMVINAGDDLADARVVAYYEALEAGLPAPPGTTSDSSTGPCQMFASTCITTRNWAKAKGYISDGPYDVNDWQDMWAVWKQLKANEEFAIQSAMFYMMYNAETFSGVAPVNQRGLTPSEVAQTCMAYNADMSNPSVEGMVYGREKAQLFYLIRKWHESFR
ncbi:glycoside hydrolase domain-containing protein [Leucobacter manosquensis]|uniref:DUF1906 domain-containing protein n=1 Tax=Leucobacter manosquensis TaxID=2810611 RepID=A0ABS5M5B1_9MICO|nr:glycoside hydrolase domain-containing protein [Leucobacter manosquensis]MBS3182378.1 DUF1906 domain-containing protein [Leucobacter manosquensis]